MVTEKIDLIISVFDKTGTKIEEITRKVQSMGGGMEQVTTSTRKLDKKTKELGNVTNKVSIGMARFKMNLLSIMFFGAMLSKTFGGLFTAIFDVFGITEMWNATLILVMLPVMELLAPVLYAIMEWFMNMPEPVKLVIGIFAGLMAIFATGLMLFGAFGLGLQGLITTFPALAGVLQGGLGGILKGIFGLITGISAPIIALIVAIIAIFVGMYIAWKENFMGMKTVVDNILNGIKTAFSGLFNILAGIINFFVALFKGDFEGVKTAVIQIFTGLFNFIIGGFQALINFITAIFIGIARIIWGVVQTIVGFFVWLWKMLVGGSIIPDIVNDIIDWFASLPGKIWNFIKGIPGQILSLFSGIGGKIAKSFEDMLPNWIVDLFKGGVNLIGKAGKLLGFQSGGIVPGSIGAPMPAIVHGGETIIPAGKGGGSVVYSPTYYITVADKNEFQRMIELNNRKMVDDIRRLTEI